jgi:hypothetical protein
MRHHTTTPRPRATDTGARRHPPAGRILVATDGRGGVRVDVLTAADLLAAEALAALAGPIRAAIDEPEPPTPLRVVGRRAA